MKSRQHYYTVPVKYYVWNLLCRFQPAPRIIRSALTALNYTQWLASLQSLVESRNWECCYNYSYTIALYPSFHSMQYYTTVLHVYSNVDMLYQHASGPCTYSNCMYIIEFLFWSCFFFDDDSCAEWTVLSLLLLLLHTYIHSVSHRKGSVVWFSPWLGLFFVLFCREPVVVDVSKELHVFYSTLL